MIDQNGVNNIMSHADHPYVICHMMSTIEGKIDSGIKGIDILGDYYNLYSDLEKSFHPDAWMCGRVTSEMFAESVGTPLPESSEMITPSDFRSAESGSGYMVAVDTKGTLRWKSNVLTFEDQTVHHIIIVVVTEQTSTKYLKYLQNKNISYSISGKSEVNFESLFRKLKSDFGINILALEGGGILNGSVQEVDLIDEISLLITPQVLSRSEAPTSFEKRGSESVSLKKYTLLDVQKLENDTVWLRYKRGYEYHIPIN
ncbi:MAG: dihydrofolate reductase family protein [bacterium]|nr:dihydrofolate reductase family protein [bacterium]